MLENNFPMRTKERKFIDEKLDSPYLLMRENGQFNHFLRPVDAKFLSAVYEEITKKDVKVYLGGSVVTGPLNKGEYYKYNDIDLLVKVNEEDCLDDILFGRMNASLSKNKEREKQILNSTEEKRQQYFQNVINSHDELYEASRKPDSKENETEEVRRTKYWQAELNEHDMEREMNKTTKTAFQKSIEDKVGPVLINEEHLQDLFYANGPVDGVYRISAKPQFEHNFPWKKPVSIHISYSIE